MMHRIFIIPLDKSEFEKEKQFIFDIADMNGYDDKFIDSIYNKHKKKNTLKQYTNLTPIHESAKRVSLPFYPQVTNKLRDNMAQKW